MASQDIHPSLLRRKIIHVDMDAFYAAVEVRDSPALAGKPLVIGGPPNSRSVVCTASYEARRFGIRSAMSCAMAARLCPETIFMHPNFEKYSSVSRAIREIFARYTNLVEPLSLDEAFLDVTNNTMGLYAVQIARRIKDSIAAELRLTASAGVGPNKLVAKIASDIRKPNGLTVVTPAEVAAFMAPLPLRKIPGVGPVTEKALAAAGLSHCRDVWTRPSIELTAQLGNRAEWIAAAARGIDESPVETEWIRKSLGEEETLAHDITDILEAKRILATISERIMQRLGESRLEGRTAQLKVKYSDFTTITRRRTLDTYFQSSTELLNAINQLTGATEIGRRPVRLLGISISSLKTVGARR